MSFSLGRIDALEFRSRPLATVPSPLQTVEDDLIFSPGDAETPRLWAGGARPFASGSLLRLSNGEMGVGFAETLGGQLILVSLVSGEAATGFDLVFDRWSLSIRRGGQEALVGRFRAEPRLAAGEARR